MGDNEKIHINQALNVIENAPRGGALAATLKNIKEEFVEEANTLRLGRPLSLAVFQRLLDGSARLKYEALPAKNKTEFARLTQALANKLRLHGGVDKASDDLSQTKQKA
ncbi:unnamed protein product [Caenorhabditis brenneri]